MTGSAAPPDAMLALVEALRRLPGVGVKSAQRMAYHLLQHDRDGALRLSQALDHAVHGIRHCERCHTFTEQPVCATCLDPARGVPIGSELEYVDLGTIAHAFSERR